MEASSATFPVRCSVSRSFPSLHFQTFHPLEFPPVARDHDQAVRFGLGSEPQVVGADGCAFGSQVGANAAVGLGDVGVQWHDAQKIDQALGPFVAQRGNGLVGHPVKEFTGGDDGQGGLTRRELGHALVDGIVSAADHE